MEKYDFNKIIDRQNTNSAKWDAAPFLFGDNDVLPMWVADMDLPVAKPITEAIKARADHEIYGYSMAEPMSAIHAVIDRMRRNYDWEVKPEWITFAPGVVPALYSILRSLTVPGDSVIHQGPVYYPFWSAIEDNGCHVANNVLKLENGKYVMDYDDLGNHFKPKSRMTPLPARVKAMILCNPHNPVGRVWKEEELREMGEIIIRNGAVVISDEIHCELLFKGEKHVPFARLSNEFEQNSITCIAPSKTFNLAGLGASVIIIPNEKLRESFKKIRKGFLPSCSIFGMVALEAAFNYGDVWLEQFLDHLQHNLDLLVNYFEQYIPKIRVIKPEGTYLVWLDCRELNMNSDELAEFMNREARVGLDHGIAFGPSGAGFERINIACPQPMLEEGLSRIAAAVERI